MLPTRALTALVAALLAAILPLGFISSADASTKPRHDLHAKGIEIGGNTNKFAIVGRVSTYPNRRITIQRKVGHGHYKFLKKVKTRSSGRFRTRIYEVGRKDTCFKVVVPATSRYRTTKKAIGCIVTT